MFWLGLFVGILITFVAVAVTSIIIKHRALKRARAMFGNFDFMKGA